MNQGKNSLKFLEISMLTPLKNIITQNYGLLLAFKSGFFFHVNLFYRSIYQTNFKISDQDLKLIHLLDQLKPIKIKTTHKYILFRLFHVVKRCQTLLNFLPSSNLRLPSFNFFHLPLSSFTFASLLVSILKIGLKRMTNFSIDYQKTPLLYVLLNRLFF